MRVLSASIAACLCASGVAHGQPPATAAPSAVVPDRVYRFSPNTTLVERGDTLFRIHRLNARGQVGPRDTTVVVFVGDSAVQLRPQGPAALPPRLALQYRRLLDLARYQQQIEGRLGRSLDGRPAEAGPSPKGPLRR